MCLGCYRDPATRAAYPSTSKFARHDARGPGCDDLGLTDEEVAALPTQPLGDEDPQPEPQPDPAPEKSALGDWCDAWAFAGDPSAGLVLTRDTEPDAIAAAQRGDVADAVKRLGPDATVEQIAGDVCLPVWSVRRRLEEIATAAG